MKLTRRNFARLTAAGIAAAPWAGPAFADAPMAAIVAEGGAAEERIEDTRSALDLAINQGCDFIQVNLVPSKEGALVARRDNELSAGTDIASPAPTSPTARPPRPSTAPTPPAGSPRISRSPSCSRCSAASRIRTAPSEPEAGRQGAGADAGRRAADRPRRLRAHRPHGRRLRAADAHGLVPGPGTRCHGPPRQRPHHRRLRIARRGGLVTGE
ncbi:MAG: hypothetical protein WDM85_19230 [Caulobacteraceae bacterium]